jgi:hypothetical protein
VIYLAWLNIVVGQPRGAFPGRTGLRTVTGRPTDWGLLLDKSSWLTSFGFDEDSR